MEPLETDPPLIVNANAVLSLSIALQCLETVTGQRRKVMQRYDCFHTIQFHPGSLFQSGERLDPLAAGEIARTLVAIADNHKSSYRYALRQA